MSDFKIFERIREVGTEFRLPGKLYTYDQMKMGNINATFKVNYMLPNRKLKSFIFQRINTEVFRSPEQIMENIDRVTSFIREHYPKDTVLHFHHTGEGKNFYYDSDGAFWRVMNFVDSETYMLSNDPAVLASCGEAFGKFQMQLSDFDGSLLHETIPDFHYTKKRLDTLFAHVAIDSVGRVGEVAEELEYLSSVREEAGALSVAFANGEYPVRVTHNDTKCNNVLFDRETKRPLVVIDLDTVMPGMATNDFGDAVRFIANTAEEDEPDLTKVYFDTGKFRAFAKGFIGQVIDAWTPAEIDALVPSAFALTVELAARFLDDYIMGDTYFKTNYPGHNLVRTRCQIRLAKDLHNKYEELNWIIRDIVEQLKNQ